MKIFRRCIIAAAAAVLLGAAAVLAVNAAVVGSTKNKIISVDEAAELKNVDCIIILGAGIRSDGSPSLMLRDRLERGIELYNSGAAEKLLMSGDHGRREHDEVNIMKDYAVGRGVPSEDVFMDHAGFSTYESMYRARDIFEAKRVIIVTQEYHLYRSIYIASALGLDACGVSAAPAEYAGGAYRDVREALARCKDFFSCIFKPAPTYLGETIPVSGDGNLTNDK